MFDTGNSGYISIDAETQEQLIASGELKPVNPKGDLFMLEGIEVPGSGIYRMSVGLLPAPFPAAVPLEVGTSNIVAFGYSFLNQYKTVWDFTGKTIYLLEK